MEQLTSNSDPVKKRRSLSPEQKYEIFLETSREMFPLHRVLRKWGIHSSDLKRIRESVKSGALKEFKGRRSRKPMVSYRVSRRPNIERRFSDGLDGRKDTPVHFLGAIVLDQKQTPTTHVDKRQVIV